MAKVSHGPRPQLGHLLHADHDRLDGLLEVYRASSGSSSAERRTLFDPFATGLRAHIDFEELHLFPDYHGGNPVRGTVLELMLDEHRRIKDALSRIEERLATDPADTADLEEELVNVLWAHDAREEEAVYPWIDRSLEREELDRLATLFERRAP
ncbi:MAG: hemerythrin domain-containing protein [Thermoplasmata archaeon]